MRIRLQITAPGRSFPFEHPGPVVRIGRDPACELRLDGPAGDAVSRQHARIALATDGATVADTGSSNGTMLNDQRVETPTGLHVGDRIQLGHTGAVLTVLELDLSPPVAPRSPVRPRALPLAALAVAALLLVALVLILTRRPSPTDAVASSQGQATSRATTWGETPKRSTDRRKVRPPPPKRRAPPALSASPELGTYVAPEGWVSVLLARAGEEYPWTVLLPNARVAADQELVSLPGYQSLLASDTGVNLTLWGTLPELSPGSPVLESVVWLHPPPDGFDLDFTLDRGRVHLAAKPKARVRLRFLGETWDLDFKDADTEVVVQLHGLPFRSESGKSAPRTYMDLFVKGEVAVRTGRQRLDLADRSQVRWEEEEANSPRTRRLPALPAWWAKPPDKADPGVVKARLSLLEWSERLGGAAPRAAKGADRKKGPAAIVPAIKTDVEELADPDNQDLGVLFLAALDEIEPLVDLLKDRRYPHVRGVAIFALQSWLARNPRHAEGLTRLLEKREGSREAEKVVSLLHFFPREACRRRATYEELIGGLGHDNLLVRDLAFLQLDRLGAGGWLPQEARTIEYDPNGPADKRQEAVRRWRELLAKGLLPSSGVR
jgi:pSer/pThr/pTyr-binding forkhead associated (FHA) protein